MSIISSALMVVSVSNMVHSLIFLIIAFVCSAILLTYHHVSYLGLAFLTIYVGSIAVLFIFVVMMIQDITSQVMPIIRIDYLPLGGLLLAPLVYIFNTIFWIDKPTLEFSPLRSANNLYFEFLDYFDSMGSLGQILFTDYFSLLIVASLVLFVGMVGAIVLVAKSDYDVSLSCNPLALRNASKNKK